MKFSDLFIKLIIEGTKTQTRRPLKDYCDPYEVGDVIHNWWGDIKIIARRFEKLHDILNYPDDLVEEGFYLDVEGFPRFKKYWDSIYGNNDEYKWSKNPEIVAYKFKYITY